MPPRHSAADQQAAYDILRALRAIMRHVAVHSKAIARASGLTLPQVLALKAVGELAKLQPEVTTADIARAIHLSPATMTGIMDRLEQRGLVERQRTSADRRKICLALTPLGVQQLRKLPSPLQDVFMARVMTLEAPERAELLRALHQVLEFMDARVADTAPLLAIEPQLGE